MNTIRKISKQKANSTISGAGGYTLNGQPIEDSNINATETVTINNIDYNVDESGKVKVTQGLMNGVLMNNSLLYTLGQNDSILNVGDVVKSVSVNGQTHSPNTNGNVDLGNIGGTANNGALTLTLNSSSIGDFTANQSENETININAATSVTQNGQSSSVDSTGNLDLGNVVKQIRFQGSTLNPQSNGLVALPNPNTTIYGSIFGGLLGVNTAYSDFSSFTNPIGLIYVTATQSEDKVDNWGYLINWKGNYIDCILGLLEYNKTANYTYTAKIRCEVFGGKDNIELYPILYKYFTASDKTEVRLCIAIKGISWNDKPLSYGYSRTVSSANSYIVGINYTDGEDTTNYPSNLISQNGITGNGVYIIDISVTNNVIDSYVVTKQGGEGVQSISVNNNTPILPDSSGNVNINSCQGIYLNGSLYSVTPYGFITLPNINTGIVQTTTFNTEQINNLYVAGFALLGMQGNGRFQTFVIELEDINSRSIGLLQIEINDQYYLNIKSTYRGYVGLIVDYTDLIISSTSHNNAPLYFFFEDNNISQIRAKAGSVPAPYYQLEYPNWYLLNDIPTNLNNYFGSNLTKSNINNTYGYQVQFGNNFYDFKNRFV